MQILEININEGTVSLSVCLLVTFFPIQSLLMCHSLHLSKVLLNTTDESSKDSIRNNSCYYMVTDGTIYIVLRTDVSTSLPIIALDFFN